MVSNASGNPSLPSGEVNDQLQQAASVARVGFWQWKLLSNAFEWSDQIYRSLNINPEDFQVTLESTLALIHPEDREETSRLMLATIEQKTEQSHRYRVVRPDGQLVWFWSNSRPVLEAGGDVLEVRGTCQDITDQVLAEIALWESEQRFRAIADDSPVMIWVSDPLGHTTFYNRAWTEMTGQPQADALGGGWLEMIHPLDRSRVDANFAESSVRREPFRIEYRLRHQDGTWSWVLDAGRPRLAPDGSFLGYVGSALDISERRAAEIAQRESQEFASSILEASSDCIEVLDLDGRLMFTNRNGLRLMEIDEFSTIAYKPWRDLWPSEYRQCVDAAVKQAHSGEIARFTSFCATMSGKPMWWDVVVSPIVDAAGTPVRLLAISRDITEAKRSRDAVAYLAHHDALTGLANRAKFHEQLSGVFSGTVEENIAVLLLDVDHFKEINDTLGHPIGDRLLKAVAGRLSQAAANSGLLARVGGDEFAVLQQCSHNQMTPNDLAEGLVDSLREPFEIDGLSLNVDVSIGIACSDVLSTSPDELLKQADIALYRAKAEGRGKYRLYEERMHEEIAHRQSMKQDLSVALQREEFQLHFQPLLDLTSNRITGFEALLRWCHPIRGLVPPADFIGLAEETGLISSMGDWVLKKACTEASGWPKGMIVSVNLSPRQFESASLPLRVSAALESAGLKPAQLQLEVTESVLLHNSAHNLQLLHSLRGMGVSIALDDFGTGFSSLSYLRNFPFDRIKIDRSFVSEIGDTGSVSAPIIKAILHLSKALNLPVTAEGVETQQQLEWLRAEGCDQAQGYLINRPVPAAEARRIVRSNTMSAA